MRLLGVRHAVAGDLFPEYAVGVEIAVLPGIGVRDSEHCAQKWGSRDNNLATETRGRFGQRPLPYQRQELGISSLEASTPAAARKFSIFHGYPPETIAQWCGVTVPTARLYKSGARKASRAVMRLFTLHRDGRVLGAEWVGWKSCKGVITDPDGNSTSMRQLRMYFFVMQYAAALAGRDPATQVEWYDLLKRA
jgi:hypothetical protein